jgi:hypothetical protein
MENKGGRPPKWSSVEQLEKEISEYFRKCDTNKSQVYIKGDGICEVPKPIPYTVEGLAAHLGTNRQTLINYQSKDAFFDTITRAKAKIQANLVERGLSKDNDGNMTKFNLINNYGYRDKPEDTNTDRKIIIEFEGDDDDE